MKAKFLSFMESLSFSFFLLQLLRPRAAIHGDGLNIADAAGTDSNGYPITLRMLLFIFGHGNLLLFDRSQTMPSYMLA
jgi:hypothetical protein